MSPQKLLADHDPHVHITDFSMLATFGDTALLGSWFVFLKSDWFKRAGIAQFLESAAGGQSSPKPAILFRGKQEIVLPALRIAPTSLPRVALVSLTCDKALYRAHHDTVRLLVAAPQHPKSECTLKLHLHGNLYAEYPISLDDAGLYLWSVQGLPEGEYEAALDDLKDVSLADAPGTCRFEVAEYRLAPLNAEVIERHLSGTTLRYVLEVTSFGEPYSGPIEIELQERGQRIGHRHHLTCNREGQCRGVVHLTGKGPYTLSVFAGERTATVALKGSGQERRETLVISELGEIREVSLLPLPQSNECRGMYIARGGANTEPFLVRRVVGSEVEITARVNAEVLRVVVVDPARGTSEEQLFSDVQAEESIHMPIPAPDGIVLIGAFIGGSAWEGWCSVLRPAELQLHCEAPKEAKPGTRIRVTLKTNHPERSIPVHLVIKDQRLLAPSDPLVELAACMKKNMSTWQEESGTGGVDRQLANLSGGCGGQMLGRSGHRPMVAFSTIMQPSPSMGMATPPSGPLLASGVAYAGEVAKVRMGKQESKGATAIAQPTITTPMLARLRMQFPEVLYNTIVKVQGQADVEVTLGDSMTRYSIEAFALVPETMDWQRVETTLEAVQPVYGELTVSPFVFAGDPVMGRLDVGAASGGAIVDVRHDGEVLPLFFDDGNVVSAGLAIPSGSVIRFPLQPGTITALVRDARKGGIDASERYVTEPGSLRHIIRHLRLLTPGDEVTLQEAHRLEIKPLPGLEQTFQVFVEGATQYPFGCIEQTSMKIVSMYVGYIANVAQEERARDYEAAILAWHKRLQSMYLPKSGFCFYPPEEGGSKKPDTHYAPLGVNHLLTLPSAERADSASKALRTILADIRAMALDAAAYYKIVYPPREIQDCHAAYQVLVNASAQVDKDKAAAFVRRRLTEHGGQTYVDVPVGQAAYRLGGQAVATRAETAYAAAALLATKEPADLARAIAATNYLTSQLNEEGRFYSTIDTPAGLALLLGLPQAGFLTGGDTV